MRLAVAPLLAATLLAGCTDDETGPAPRADASIAEWRWAPRDELPAAKPPVKEPTIPSAEPREEDPAPEPPPPPPKLPDLDQQDDAALVKAEVLKNGVALPPLESPPQVRAIFEAGNTIARSPYKWGGGHGKWRDKGYDCSGSVSYALAAAGLLDRPLASGPLMKWGKPGKGKWITIYTNPGHVFMIVAGVRFDTTARGVTGSRWINDSRSTSGYVARHPQGL